MATSLSSSAAAFTGPASMTDVDPVPTATSTAPIDRYTPIRLLYGNDTFTRLHSSRLLVVGAGGIGCELLKSLVLTGFSQLTVIDLDTIDVSNLNRQFLFRRNHVGQAKAIVARDAAIAFNPDAHITAHQGNIKDAQYSNPAYFGQFDLVLNALDNIDARRHVNRLCLTAHVPLIDSGTQATSGQVIPTLPSLTECYECQPIAQPKQFAVCTIRSTPDKPVHCVAWAKYALEAIFGAEDEGNVMSDLRREIRWEEAEGLSADERGEAFGRRLLELLFERNINKQLENKETWLTRTPPTPIRVSTLLPPSTADGESGSKAFVYGRSMDQQVLSTVDTVRMLFLSLATLFASHSTAGGGLLGSLRFDKDDDVVMDVVSCLANLRMLNFHIPPLSRFAVKGIAGNIVHAIATTNAVAAGVIVMEAVKLLTEKRPTAPSDLAQLTSRQVYISPYKPHLLQPQQLEPPRRTCYVCSDSSLTLYCDTSLFTLRQLYEAVLEKELSLMAASVDIYNRDNAIGSKDDCEDDYLDRPLDGVRAGDGAMVSVEDEAQGGVKVRLVVRDRKEWRSGGDREKGYELVGEVKAAAASAAPDERTEAAGTGGDGKSKSGDDVQVVDDGDELEIVEEQDGAAGHPRHFGSNGAKAGTNGVEKHRKKRRPLNETESESKRMRTDDSSVDVDVEVID